MSAGDLARAIEALEDDEIRSRVVDGDLTAFAGLGLTDEEIDQLEGAASEYPDVVGFDIRTGLISMNLIPGAIEFDKVIQPDVTLNKAKAGEKAAAEADKIIRG